jgi:hypothetical protein
MKIFDKKNTKIIIYNHQLLSNIITKLLKIKILQYEIDEIFLRKFTQAAEYESTNSLTACKVTGDTLLAM